MFLKAIVIKFVKIKITVFNMQTKYINLIFLKIKFFLNFKSSSAKIVEIIIETKSKIRFWPMFNNGLISSPIKSTAKNELIKTVSKVKIIEEFNKIEM